MANVFVTNGYMTAEALSGLTGLLHAANVDLKSFSDDFYRAVVGARLHPVLETIRRMVAAGVWVEVTTLLIPGHNDSDDELAALAGFLAGVDRDLPWHVSRFHPAYELTDVASTPPATIDRAVAIGAAAGLRYVYAGNVPGHDTESTRCPACGETVIERDGFVVRRMRLDGTACAACGAVAPADRRAAEGGGGLTWVWSAATSLPTRPSSCPTWGGDRLAEVRPTVDAMIALGREAAQLAPDTIVLLSPHAPIDPRHLTVCLAGRYVGSLAMFGAAQVAVEPRGRHRPGRGGPRRGRVGRAARARVGDGRVRSSNSTTGPWSRSRSCSARCDGRLASSNSGSRSSRPRRIWPSVRRSLGPPTRAVAGWSSSRAGT